MIVNLIVFYLVIQSFTVNSHQNIIKFNTFQDHIVFSQNLNQYLYVKEENQKYCIVSDFLAAILYLNKTNYPIYHNDIDGDQLSEAYCPHYLSSNILYSKLDNSKRKCFMTLYNVIEAMSKEINEMIISDVQDIGYLFNPSILPIKFHSHHGYRLLLSQRFQPRFAWIYNVTVDKYNWYVERDPIFDEMNSMMTKNDEDSRLFKISNEMIMVISSYYFYSKVNDDLFNSTNGLHRVSSFVTQSYRTLKYKGNSKIFVLSEPILFLLESDLEKFKFSDHSPMNKNWTPFLYNGRVLYVDTIEPFHVVEVPDVSEHKPFVYYTNPEFFNKHKFSHDYLDLKTIVATTISQTSCDLVSDMWFYGALRGSTQAMLFRGNYLSFFHSRSEYDTSNSECNTKNHIYLFGAYLFSPNPPFRLLKLSKFPIINENLVNSHYFKSVVFPMNFYYQDAQNEITENSYEAQTIVLSSGKKDRFGIIIKLNIELLLNSLVPVC